VRRGEHRLGRPAERGRGGGDVRPLGHRVDDLTVQQPQLDPHRLPVDPHGALGPVQDGAVDALLAQSECRALPEHHVAHRADDRLRAEHRQRVRRPALLHQDRRQPCVVRAGREQRLQHPGPQPGVEVVDVRAQQQGRGVHHGFDRLADQQAEHVGQLGRIATAGTGSAAQQHHLARDRPGLHRCAGQQREHGRWGDRQRTVRPVRRPGAERHGAGGQPP
jgi:hypothetical protein